MNGVLVIWLKVTNYISKESSPAGIVIMSAKIVIMRRKMDWSENASSYFIRQFRFHNLFKLCT